MYKSMKIRDNDIYGYFHDDSDIRGMNKVVDANHMAYIHTSRVKALG